jgi:hypothetical protein
MQNILEEWRDELVQFRSDRQICGRLNLLALPDEDECSEMKQEIPKGNQGNGKIKVNIIEPS